METSEAMPTPKLLDQVRTVARVKHFSLSTERPYVGWIRRFILFHHKQHPMELAETEIRQFISHLAVDAKISASTQTLPSGLSCFFIVTYSSGTCHISTTSNAPGGPQSFRWFLRAAKCKPFLRRS
jgi:hypothetical protein